MIIHLHSVFSAYTIFRHVQVNNESAIEFYRKFGFQIVETKDQYYKRIEPAGAHVLEKILRTDDLATGNNNSQIGSSHTSSEATTTPTSVATTTNTNTAGDLNETNHLPNGIDNHHQTKSKITS